MAKIRRNAVDNGSIISAIVRGSKLGKTNAQVAAELGMALPSFQSRSSAIRSVLAEAGRDLPCLGKRGRPSKNIAETLASLDADVLAALSELDSLGNPVQTDATDATDATDDNVADSLTDTLDDNVFKTGLLSV